MIKSSLLIALLLSSPLIADMSFEEWQNQENRAFKNYQTQMDKEFIEMLKRDWQEYQSMQTPTSYQRPKPQYQPILQLEPKPQKLVKIPSNPPKLIAIPKPPKKEYIKGYKQIRFKFFSLNINLHYDKRLKPNIGAISNSAIADFWNKSSSINYKLLIKEIKEYQDIYGLDGWSSYLLVNKLSKEIVNHDINSQNLLTWFILVKLGVDTKVGFSSNQISLLIHSDEMLYGVNFFTIDGKKYYRFNNNGTKKLKIYKGEINTLYAMKFLNQKVKIPFNIKYRKIRFNYQSREYQLNIPYNTTLVQLYKTYPQLDYNRYVELSKLSQDFIEQELKPIVSSMSKIEAINFLLRLTQNGFRYKTDTENFGKEKVMFFEETIHYAYSDCEDRAIFFATLVKQLLKVDIVFVKYPNHLATAIRLKSKIGDDKIIYQNQRYYIADPTYSNANIGQAMPQIKGQKIKIIKLF